MRPFLDPLDEYERLAKNLPHPNIDKSYPKVTDGTTASIVRKTPRRIVQQIPTGRVKGNGWLPIVAGFIFTERIIPNANEQNAFIDKCWRMIRNALTYGAAHSYVPFVNRGEYFGPDLKVPYIKNVKFEAGKLSDLESNCIPLEFWYQPADIDAIINKEKKLAKAAKKRGETYESTWDLKALEEVKLLITSKQDQDKSVVDQKSKDDTNKDGVKLVLMLQRGEGATFYTIHPSTQKIVRRKKNKDPRGEIPFQTMYFETDGINPLGTGIVEQLAPIQNLTDAEMQMYQFERALMLAPPTIKRGNWNKNQAKLVPNAIIDLGSDQNASWEVLKRDTSALNNFPATYGLLKSQMLNLASSPDTSISAEIGNPGFSKTPAGVNAQVANVSVDDNYVRKQFETWFERWAETAINLYFAERTGSEEIQLDKETASQLRKLEESGDLEPGFVSDDDKILIDYDSATEALQFEVDASTSNMKNNAEQLQANDALLERYEQSPQLQALIPKKKIIGVWNAIVRASGVEDPEQLAVSEEELQQMEQEQIAAQQEQMAQAMQAQAAQLPTGSLPQPNQMPQPVPEAQTPQEAMQPTGMQQPTGTPDTQPLSEDDQAFVQAMRDMGYPDEKIGQALAMQDYGFSDEDIVEMLHIRAEDIDE